MVNTIGVSQASEFIPELWAQAAIPVLRANIVAAPRVMRDSEVAAFNVGDVLHVPYPGTFAVNDKAANTEYTIQQPSGAADVQLTLNKHKEVSFTIEDIVRAQANQDVLNRYGYAAGIALAEQLETDVQAEMLAGAAAAAVGTYGTDCDYTELLDAWKALTDAKAPEGDRFAVIATKDAIKIATDSTIANWIAFSNPGIVRAPNSLGSLAGFDEVFSSQLVSVTSTTNTHGLGWRRDGLLLAYRAMPEPPAGLGAKRASVLDQMSGAVINVLMGYDIRLGGVQVTYELLYGVKTLQGAKIVEIKS